MKALLDHFDRYRDHGLLLLRVGLGLMMILAHGAPKLFGGPEVWAKVGGAMSVFGIGFAPTFWGLMAALAEFVGGLLVIVGLAVRPASLAITFTMVVATAMHLANGDGLRGSSHPIEVGIAFLALVLVGGGRFSLDARRTGQAAAATGEVASA